MIKPKKYIKFGKNIYRNGWPFTTLKIVTDNSQTILPLFDIKYKVSRLTNFKFYGKNKFGKFFCRVSVNKNASFWKKHILCDESNGYLNFNGKNIASVFYYSQINKPLLIIESYDKKWCIKINSDNPPSREGILTISEKKHGIIGTFYTDFQFKQFKDIIKGFTGLGNIFIGNISKNIDNIRNDENNVSIQIGLQTAIAIIEIVFKRFASDFIT